MLSPLHFPVAVLALSLARPAAALPGAEPVVGRIAHWWVSQPVPVSNIALEQYPDAAALRALQWTAVTSDPAGRIDIARYCKSLGGDGTRVFIRTTLPAAQRKTLRLALGFSESASLYLNGRTVFRGRNPAPPVNADALAADNIFWLELKPGDNELMLALSRVSAAWGFVARDLDAVFQHPGLTKLWEVTTGLRGPESVACDPVRRVLYVSNTRGGGIARLSFDGRMLDPTWARGLNGPTGLKLFRGALYAVERTGVAVIDPETGAIVRRLPLPGAAFPNDLAISGDGTIYVTDTFKGAIHRITSAGAGLWLQDPALAQINGILVEPTRLLVGVTGDGAIKSVDLATERIENFTVLGAPALMDGLVSDGAGGYLFSDYFGRIFRADAAGRTTLLLDRTGPNQFCADFDYLPEEGLLVVPSLYDQRLTAYQLNLEDVLAINRRHATDVGMATSGSRMPR